MCVCVVINSPQSLLFFLQIYGNISIFPIEDYWFLLELCVCRYCVGYINRFTKYKVQASNKSTWTPIAPHAAA